MGYAVVLDPKRQCTDADSMFTNYSKYGVANLAARLRRSRLEITFLH